MAITHGTFKISVTRSTFGLIKYERIPSDYMCPYLIHKLKCREGNVNIIDRITLFKLTLSNSSKACLNSANSNSDNSCSCFDCWVWGWGDMLMPNWLMDIDINKKVN